MSADDDEAVLVSLTEKRQNGVQRVWNLTINEKSDQYPLVPLFKQPEVQIFECAADRGFMTFEFPAPYPSGSTFNGICYGGPKEGVCPKVTYAVRNSSVKFRQKSLTSRFFS
jgi:hypothetical protein